MNTLSKPIHENSPPVYQVQNRNDDFLNTGANRNTQKQRRLRNLILVRRHALGIVHVGFRGWGKWSTSTSSANFGRFTGGFAMQVARQFLEARVNPERVGTGDGPGA